MKKWEGISDHEVRKYDRLVCRVIREKFYREPDLEFVNVGRVGVLKALVSYKILKI